MEEADLSLAITPADKQVKKTTKQQTSQTKQQKPHNTKYEPCFLLLQTHEPIVCAVTPCHWCTMVVTPTLSHRANASQELAPITGLFSEELDVYNLRQETFLKSKREKGGCFPYLGVSVVEPAAQFCKT